MDNTKFYINAMHLFFILPFLLYIGISKCKAPKWMFEILIGLCITGILFHSFKTFDLYQKTYY